MITRAQNKRASGGDKITHLLEYHAKLCLKRLADPVGGTTKGRKENKETQQSTGNRETAAGFGDGCSCVLNYRQLLVGSLLALM